MSRRGDDGIPRDVVAFLDERTGAAGFTRKSLRYLFPDHWSFLLGEVAMYAFIVLVGTGIYLALYFDASTATTVYHGSYAPLRGFHMSQAYRSVLELSWDVKAGLLIRQTHHWAANVFVGAVVIHMMRVFFTGAYRKPRELTYLIGLLMLFVALLEGYLGYSLVDDLLSGMGLAIGYAVALSVPVIGANMALGIFGHPFPGDPEFWGRMYIGHVLLLPLLIATLLGIHLALVASRHHTQFRRTERQSETRLVGTPTFPGQAPKSLGLFVAVAAVLFLLGGLIQINPIWQWGPFDIARATNGAQPDWYLGWLIGALRLMPGFDLRIGDYTLIPGPFWGGALLPVVVLVVLAAAPWVEKRVTGDRSEHNLADRPRDAPRRTAFGWAMVTFVALILLSGSADRAYVTFGFDYDSQLWLFRVLVVVAPIVAYFVARRICRELQMGEGVQDERERAEEEAREPRRPVVPPGPPSDPGAVSIPPDRA